MPPATAPWLLPAPWLVPCDLKHRRGRDAEFLAECEAAREAHRAALAELREEAGEVERLEKLRETDAWLVEEGRALAEEELRLGAEAEKRLEESEARRKERQEKVLALREGHKALEDR